MSTFPSLSRTVATMTEWLMLVERASLIKDTCQTPLSKRVEYASPSAGCGNSFMAAVMTWWSVIVGFG